MSNEELIQIYKAGNITALDELTEQNMRLIKFVANKFTIHCNFIDVDDLVQQGWTGFLRAVQTYKPDLHNNAKFSTWAFLWIRQAISRYLTQRCPKDETSLSEPIGESLTLEDTLEDEDASKYYDDIERRELRFELEQVIDATLTLREKEVIKLKYGWDNGIEWTFEDIGESYEITKQAARAIHERAIRNIRRTPWGRQRVREYYCNKRAILEYKNTQATAEVDATIEWLNDMKDWLRNLK